MSTVTKKTWGRHPTNFSAYWRAAPGHNPCLDSKPRSSTSSNEAMPHKAVRNPTQPRWMKQTETQIHPHLQRGQAISPTVQNPFRLTRSQSCRSSPNPSQPTPTAGGGKPEPPASTRKGNLQWVRGGGPGPWGLEDLTKGSRGDSS